MYIYNVLCKCMCIPVCRWMYVWVHVCLVACCIDPDLIVRSKPVNRDPDLCSMWTRYTGDLKTDIRDDSEIHTNSCSEDHMAIRIQSHAFPVSVCSCIIFLFIVASSIYMLLVSFHVTICFILPVWLRVSFLVMSVSAHFICTVDMSVYLRQLIWWLVPTIDSGLVMI